jgi:tetratricopeptide (TPR) repeat protein
LVAAWQQTGVLALDWKEKINQKLLELDPNNPELFIDRALIKYDRYLIANQAEQVDIAQQQSLIQKIKSDLEMSLSLKENYVLGYYNLGLLFLELNDQTNALANITKAYELNPLDKTIVLTLKKLYLNQDKVNEAEELLLKYLESVPADNEVRLQLALLYKDTERQIEAKIEVNKILTSDPENETAQALLKQIK